MSPDAPPKGACELLPWDAAFFGFGVARVTGRRLAATHPPEIDSFCREHAVRLLYLEADIDHPDTVRLAEAHGFGLVDVRVVLDAGPPRAAGPSALPVREATEEDLPALLPIARTGFRDSRFYFDPQLPDARCDALYERWITESLRGFADRVLVACDGSACGFVTCDLVDGGRTGRIGLIGVGERARGRGVGETLVAAAQEWFASRGAGGAVVTTQARNVGAQRLYARRGFRPRQVSLYYHKWYGAGGGS